MSADAPTPDDQATTDVPLLAGRYQLLEQLGQGGMGAVFRARDAKLDRAVALKMLPEGSAPDADAVRRFRREAKALAKLSHPGIIQAYDSGEDGGKHFLVMELVEGRSLARELADKGRVPPTRAADYGHQAALALHHAHKSGLIHRDVKPSNLLVAPDGRVKLLDLGLARFLQDQVGDASLTRQGTGLGTPDYASPEQFRDARHADPRSDVYSLGCTLYHLIAGRVPFPSSSMSEKVQAHETKEPPPLDELCPDMPAGLALAVHKMMAKRPADRFRDMAEAADALAPYVATSSPSFRALRNTSTWDGSRLATTPAMSRRRALRPWLVAGVAAVLALIAVGAVGLWAGWFRAGAPPLAQSTDPALPGPAAPQADGGPKKEGPRPADDPNVLTVAQKPGAARYQTIAAALEAVKPGQTIRVLDNAVYRESLRIIDRTGMAGVTLEAIGGATLALESAGERSFLLDISGVPDFTVRGFHFRATRTPRSTLVAVQGACPGLRLEQLKLTADESPAAMGIEVYGSAGSAPDQAPAVIRDCVFRGCAVSTFFLSRPGNGFFRTAVRDCLFADCEFGVQISGGSAQDIQVVGNRFHRVRVAALQFTLLSDDAENLVVANNTVLESATAFRLWDRAIRGKQVRFSNNLLLGGEGMDMLVIDAINGQDSRGPGDGVAATRTYHISHNWREGKEWGTGKGWIPADPKKGDVLTEKIDGVNRDPKSPDFLRPAKDSPLATAGAGAEDPSLPRYVGALPPEGAEPWDWDRAWRMPKDARLLTVSKEASTGGEYRTINAALKDAEPWTTIRVLDKSEYEETLVIDDKSQEGVCLDAPLGPTLVGSPGEPALTIASVPNVRVSGFIVRGHVQGRLGMALVAVRGAASGVVLEGLQLRSPEAARQMGIALQDVRVSRDESPLTVRGCDIRVGYDGIHLAGRHAPGEGPACAGVRVLDNRIAGGGRGIWVGGSVARVLVAGNAVWDCMMSGLQVENLNSESRQILLVNNTVRRCATALRVWQESTADPISAGQMEALNNLLLEAVDADVLYVISANNRGDARELGRLWRFAHNARDYGGTAEDGLPPQPTDVRLDKVPFDRADADSPQRWRPAKDSPLAHGGAGLADPSLPTYISALPPEGADSGDWDRTWRARTKKAEDKK
jgi:nitrous oxidase accessory protein NosD